jgi:7,8-dihydroneopterin aldolase/epimerase/oxygenase
MTDRVALINMRFDGKHGVLPEERENAQPFEVDAEIYLDVRPAGLADDITRTVDYREVFRICREVVEGPSFQLIEAVAETIATRLLVEFRAFAVSEVAVRVRKPRVALPGSLDTALVEIRRRPRRDTRLTGPTPGRPVSRG